LAWDKIVLIFAPVVLDGPVRVKFACAEVTKLLFNASVINFVNEKTRPSTFSLWGKVDGLFLPKISLVRVRILFEFLLF